jgi:hypothetical protein
LLIVKGLIVGISGIAPLVHLQDSAYTESIIRLKKEALLPGRQKRFLF